MSRADLCRLALGSAGLRTGSTSIGCGTTIGVLLDADEDVGALRRRAERRRVATSARVAMTAFNTRSMSPLVAHGCSSSSAMSDT
jgi:hypothetical protein